MRYRWAGWWQICASATLVMALGEPAAAQERGRWDNVKREFEYAGKDAVRVWSSPFRIESADLPPLIAVTAPGLLIGAFDEQIQQWMLEHEGSLPMRALGPFRVGQLLNRVGRTYVQVPLSVTLYLVGIAADNADLRDAGIGCITSNLSTTLPRATFSRFIGRKRPLGEEGAYAFDPFTFDNWDNYSFPGGHVSNIMACASFWSHRFELGAAEPALYLLATAIGFGRVADRAHWASDTWFGLAVGFAVGRLVADRISDRRAADALDPAFMRTEVPIRIGWRITF